MVELRKFTEIPKEEQNKLVASYREVMKFKEFLNNFTLLRDEPIQFKHVTPQEYHLQVYPLLKLSPFLMVFLSCIFRRLQLQHFLFVFSCK